MHSLARTHLCTHNQTKNEIFTNFFFFSSHFYFVHAAAVTATRSENTEQERKKSNPEYLHRKTIEKNIIKIDRVRVHVARVNGVLQVFLLTEAFRKYNCCWYALPYMRKVPKECKIQNPKPKNEILFEQSRARAFTSLWRNVLCASHDH